MPQLHYYLYWNEDNIFVKVLNESYRSFAEMPLYEFDMPNEKSSVELEFMLLKDLINRGFHEIANVHICPEYQRLFESYMNDLNFRLNVARNDV